MRLAFAGRTGVCCSRRRITGLARGDPWKTSAGPQRGPDGGGRRCCCLRRWPRPIPAASTARAVTTTARTVATTATAGPPPGAVSQPGTRRARGSGQGRTCQRSHVPQLRRGAGRRRRSSPAWGTRLWAASRSRQRWGGVRVGEEEKPGSECDFSLGLLRPALWPDRKSHSDPGFLPGLALGKLHSDPGFRPRFSGADKIGRCSRPSRAALGRKRCR